MAVRGLSNWEDLSNLSIKKDFRWIRSQTEKKESLTYIGCNSRRQITAREYGTRCHFVNCDVNNQVDLPATASVTIPPRPVTMCPRAQVSQRIQSNIPPRFAQPLDGMSRPQFFFRVQGAEEPLRSLVVDVILYEYFRPRREKLRALPLQEYGKPPHIVHYPSSACTSSVHCSNSL